MHPLGVLAQQLPQVVTHVAPRQTCSLLHQPDAEAPFPLERRVVQ